MHHFTSACSHLVNFYCKTNKIPYECSSRQEYFNKDKVSSTDESKREIVKVDCTSHKSELEINSLGHLVISV